jgi:hypothetical protein
VQELGLFEDINDSGRVRSLLNELMKLDRQTQWPEMRRLAGVPDFAVGSAQAITKTASSFAPQ